MTAYQHSRSKIIRDIFLIIISVVVSIWLERSGNLDKWLNMIGGSIVLKSFITGLFFTSAFTTAPAIAVFSNLTGTHSLPLVALFGAVGAVTGDIFLFRFVRDELSGNILSLMGKPVTHQIKHIFKLRIFHWFSPFVAAIIIASPLPDELAMAVFGFAGTRMALFLPFSLAANFTGIILIATAAQAVF